MLINLCPQLFAFTGINFRGMLHHVCDVGYDENMCGPIKTRNCRSTNWLNLFCTTNLQLMNAYKKWDLLKSIIMLNFGWTTYNQNTGNFLFVCFSFLFFIMLRQTDVLRTVSNIYSLKPFHLRCLTGFRLRLCIHLCRAFKTSIFRNF